MAEDAAKGWELRRQDDNGTEFLVARYATEEEAKGAQRDFEAHAHKQHYWVTRASD